MNRYLGCLLAISIASGTISLAPLPARADVTDSAQDPNATSPGSDAYHAAAAWADYHSDHPDAAARSPKALSTNTSLGTLLSGSGYTKNYRGSWLMWADQHVEFGYNGTTVTWSSCRVDYGAIFPNNVTFVGTSVIWNTGSSIRYDSTVNVGAGIPTPWGNANVYNATSTAWTVANGDGGWSSGWLN